MSSDKNTSALNMLTDKLIKKKQQFVSMILYE